MLFFQRFWGVLGVPAQVTVLVVTPLVVLTATEFAARRERTLYYASLFSLVAFGAFVLNLTVLGSIFNLTPSQDALLAWGIFGLLLAYTYRLQLPLAAGLIGLLSYLAAGFSSWLGADWLSFPERPENFLLCGVGLIIVPGLHLQAFAVLEYSEASGSGVGNDRSSWSRLVAVDAGRDFMLLRKKYPDTRFLIVPSLVRLLYTAKWDPNTRKDAPGAYLRGAVVEMQVGQVSVPPSQRSVLQALSQTTSDYLTTSGTARDEA